MESSVIMVRWIELSPSVCTGLDACHGIPLGAVPPPPPPEVPNSIQDHRVSTIATDSLTLDLDLETV